MQLVILRGSREMPWTKTRKELVKCSTASLVNPFLALCKPQKSFCGFRTDLVACIQLAVFLLFKTENINNVKVDIWGDGCAIGGTEVTRMAFRLLSEDISAQSATSVFCFAGTPFSKIILKSFLHKFFSQLETKMIFLAYRGKDSRFAMELNLGPSVVGCQESGWLFQQTNQLKNLGAKLTYSGDTPFLHRLILGSGNDLSTDYPSKMALHVKDERFLPSFPLRQNNWSKNGCKDSISHEYS